MPGPAFCALDQAYGDWGKPPKVDEPPVIKPMEEQKPHQNMQQLEQNTKDFCPNCKNCLNANNMLQQRILNTTISPRPQWIPQNPYAYVPHDPYNRYWANFPMPSYREDFTQGIEHFGNISHSDMLNIVLIVLIALFFIQLAEMFCYYKQD